MGVDYSYLSERVSRNNGALAQGVLSKIIDVLEDDKPFKEVRIKKLVDDYQKNRDSV